MRFKDDEFEEWHEIVVEQRKRYRRVLENIVGGVPIIAGMASDYRKLTPKEIVDMAKRALDQ